MLRQQKDPLMQVILHTGVHATDDDRLLRALLRNADGLAGEGVAVPGPGRYRRLLSETINSVGGQPAAAEAREVMLDAILNSDPSAVKRLILSHENLFSVPKLTFGGGRFYRHAEARIDLIRQIFRGDRIEVFMCLRNPATFIPAVFRQTPQDELADFLNGVDPLHLRWSHFVQRLRRALPDTPFTLWCNEDTPLIWGRVLRELLGVGPDRRIASAFDMFEEITEPEGVARFQAYLADHPDLDRAQQQAVMSAFLDKYAIAEAVEEEIDLPGWDEALVSAMTRAYEADVEFDRGDTRRAADRAMNSSPSLVLVGADRAGS